MPALPEDLYDCLAATLFRTTPRMHMEISHFSHGLRLYSSETRIKERRQNARDIVRVRQTCKAMLAAVRALEKDELRAAMNVFWKSVYAGPSECFVFPSVSEVLSLPWTMESHVQTMRYEGKEDMKLYTKRGPRMLKMVLVTKFMRSCFPKILFRIGEPPGVGDGESGSDSDDYMPHTEVWTTEKDLTHRAKVWLEEQHAVYDASEAKAVKTK